jgi:hypothetical protein
MTFDLYPLFSETDAGFAAYTAEQREAWKTASFLRDTGLRLDHWKQEIRKQGAFLDPASDSRISSEELLGGEEEGDEELKEVLRISREDYYGAGPSILLTPSSSPSIQNGSRHNVITIEDEGGYEDDHDSLYSRPSRTKFHLTPKHCRPSPKTVKVYQRSRRRSRSASPTMEDDSTIMVTPRETNRSQFSGGSIDQLLGSSILNRRSSVPVSDAIEVDM